MKCEQKKNVIPTHYRNFATMPKSFLIIFKYFSDRATFLIAAVILNIGCTEI